MTAAALPAVIVIGGVAYVLSQESGPAPIPAPGTGGTTYPGYDLSGMDFGGGAPDTQAKVSSLLAAGEAKLAAMSDGEKRAAAQQLNSTLGLSPPLTGAENWQQITQRAAGAAGSQLCSAIPGIGSMTGPLCGLGAAYLGVHLEDWVQGSLQDVQNWINNNIPGAIQSVEDDIAKWLDGLF